MPNEILNTTSTTAISLLANTNLYMTPNASMTVDLFGASAISATGVNAIGLDAKIEGRIVGFLTLPAITVARLLATEIGNNAITFGASARLTQFSNTIDAAIRMVGTENTVNNAGVIDSNGRGIDILGAGGTVLNFGTINAKGLGIDLEGDFSVVANSGRISGSTGIIVTGKNCSISNSGVIETTIANQALGDGGIVLIVNAAGHISNSGMILAHDANGVTVQSIRANQTTLDNSGSIAAGLAGISVFDTLSTLSVHNSGQISGTRQGIDFNGEKLFVVNTSTGSIFSASGNGIESDSTINLINHGTISASGEDGHAIKLGFDAAFSSIKNFGTITSTFAAAFDATALLAGGPVFLTNHGSVAGNYVGAATTDQVRNFGSMSLVSTGNGADFLRNAGLIEGSVLLGSGADTYRGGLGQVEGGVDGGQDSDSLFGGGFEDSLVGGTGNDVVEGREGNDSLEGNSGADILRGGAGDDLLDAGADADLLVGGSGADTFVFTTALAISDATSRDRIFDFGNGADRINLEAFMPSGTYIGSTGFHATAAPEVRYDKATGIVTGDVDGNGTVDWTLVLTTKPTLTAADFVF